MKTLILLSLLQLGTAGNDAYWTNHNNMQLRHHENNPLARPFVGTPTGCVFYFSASSAIHIGGAVWLHKHHHNWLANLLLLEGITDHGIAGVQSELRAH